MKKMVIKYTKTASLLTCFLLSSCANLCPDHLNPNESHYQNITYKQRQLRLKKIKSWNINGSFSCTFPNPKTHKIDTQTARFIWNQKVDPKQYNITIRFMADIATLTLKSNDSGITLEKNGKQSPNVYPSPEALTQATLGFTLPVSNLYYWTRGLASPLAPHNLSLTLDAYHHLIHVQQGDWSISFGHFLATKQGDIPLRLDILNPKEQLKLRLVTRKKSWENEESS